MTDSQFYVYKHINKINGKQYIGITSRLPEERWGIQGANYRTSPYFWSAIQKYGWENFDHEILFSNLTHDEACKKEKELIAEYKTQDKTYGYNIMEGGIASILPQEVREKISHALMGNKNGLGHPCSEEKKRKISEAQKGRKLTAEHKAKLSMAKKGKKHGRPSEETIKKISDAHKKKPVVCQETGIIYPSIQNCAKTLGIDATYVCACCKGRVKSIKGFHFHYYENPINA